MSDNAVPNHDAEAERLEAALERIAALARRPAPMPAHGADAPDTGRQQAAAELDALIGTLRERLGEFEDPHHAPADGTHGDVT